MIDTSREVRVSAALSPFERWWRARTDYPYPDRWFRPSSTQDLLRSMRAMLRVATVGLILLVGMVVFAVAGYGLPSWLSSLFAPVAVGVMFGVTPQARTTLAGMILSMARSRWSDAWLDADVALPRLWMMLRSPVSLDAFVEYATVLDKDKTARVDGGIDPRVVWALVAREMSVARVVEYREVGADAEQAIMLTDRNISPVDWAELTRIGVARNARFEQILRFVDWVRGTRASLHPSQFADAPAGARTVSECLPVMAAWVSLSGFTLRAQTPCQRGPELPCEGCGGTEATGHRAWFVNVAVGTQRVAEWTRMAGVLAPYFVAAGIGYSEAAAMVSSESPPSVDDLVFLAAFKD